MSGQGERETQAGGGLRHFWGQVHAAFREGRRYFQEELWDVDLRTLPRLKKMVISLVRIVGMVIQGVIHDKCGLQSATLTYLTLLALVPILALMFSLSKGLGAQDMLLETMGLIRAEAEHVFEVDPESRLAEAPEQFHEIAVTVFSAVDRTNVRTLGSLGLVLLLWTVIRVAGKVENAFNDVWGVRRPRGMARRFADYISILVVVPILVIFSSSSHAFLSSDRALQMVERHLGDLALLYELVLRGTAGGAMVMAFVFLLMFMPNTRVRFFPALVGGVVTGVSWLAVQSLYFMAQGNVTRYNAIYGTFAALPFFLIWLRTSWVIVLLGAEVSFAVQNHRTYHREQRAKRATPATLLHLGLLVMVEVGRRFLHGEGPWSAERFSDEFSIPVRLTGMAVDGLCRAGLMREVAEASGQYVPGRDLSLITPADIERVFRGTVDPQVARLIQTNAPGLDQATQAQREGCDEILGRTSLRDLLDAAHSDGCADQGA